MTALLGVCPGAAKEKDRCEYTPLHTACLSRASFEVVAVLLEVWPEAAKEKDRRGYTPLHTACLYRAAPDVVAALLKAWHEAIKETHRFGETPLKMACLCGASFEVTTLLDNFNFAGDIKVLFSHLYALCSNDTDNPSPNEIMDCFIHVEMWNGVTLNVDRNPAVIKTIGLVTEVMADLLSAVGWCCSLKTMWEVLCNEHDLLKGV
eukprot:15344627-Ditylum_brightwellii.AAC.1